MTFYWLYGRLGVHVGESDSAVAEHLREYADDHVKGGRGALQSEHFEGVLREHHEAQGLYVSVATGRF